MKIVTDRPPSRSRSRRTQGERSAATRQRVIEAAREVLAESGLRRATMSVIAARAGVSWGAMQHQFGDKESIFDAVLEDALGDLTSAFSGVREAAPEPVARVREFTERCRELLRGPSYRAFVEIQLGRGRDADASSRAWSEHVAATLGRAWSAAFGDLLNSGAAQRFAFVVLSGIAAESVLFPGVDDSENHFLVLEESLVRLLGVEGAT